MIYFVKADVLTEFFMEKRIEYGDLFEIYGSLLTPRQRECVRLFYLEDVTAPEIAAQTGVSRQAVHEALRAAENQLALWESRIRAGDMRRRMVLAQELLEGVEAAKGQDGLDAARELLDQEVTESGI